MAAHAVMGIKEMKSVLQNNGISGDNLWSLLDQDGLVVYEDLKLILKATKCDNMLIMASFGKDDKIRIEKFMSQTLHKIIPKEKYEMYYGIYEDHPEVFQLVAGHDKQLDLIAKHCKRFIAASKLAVNAPTNEDSSSASNNSSATLQAQQNPVGSSKSAPLKMPSLQLEKERLEKLINDHISSNYEENHKVTARVAADGLESFNAEVMCPVCSKLKKITKVGLRWGISNFYTHLRTHLASESDAKIRKIDTMFRQESQCVNAPVKASSLTLKSGSSCTVEHKSRKTKGVHNYEEDEDQTVDVPDDDVDENGNKTADAGKKDDVDQSGGKSDDAGQKDSDESSITNTKSDKNPEAEQIF